MSVLSQSTEVPFEGPIPLSRIITYSEGDEIVILSEDFIDMSFEPPSGWTLKETPTLRLLMGRASTSTLTSGESLSRVIYVHDYFSSITPGTTELVTVVKFRPQTEGAGEPVVLRDVCMFTVLDPDLGRFADRLQEIHRQIASEQSAEKRLEVYESIASLSHPELLQIFLDSLLDTTMLMFHATARRRSVDLGETYGKRKVIIEYLANHGGRYDVEFFRSWHQKQVRLSEEEIARLCDSSSLWTRLFCLEHYEGQYNRRGLIESLKSELEELTERVHKLENAK